MDGMGELWLCGYSKLYEQSNVTEAETALFCCGSVCVGSALVNDRGRGEKP